MCKKILGKSPLKFPIVLTDVFIESKVHVQQSRPVTDVFIESKVHVQQSRPVFEAFPKACGDSPSGISCYEFSRWGCNYAAIQQLF